MRVQIAELPQQERAIFAYDLSAIKEEIEKRSSYIGKMRSDKEHEHFIDRMSLTEGESFLSDEMIGDAIVQVYEWLQAFGREVATPFSVTDEGQIVFELQPASWWDRAALVTVDRYIKEAVISYVLYRWFEMVNPEEAQSYFDKYENYAHQAQMGMNASKAPLERRHNTPFNTIFQ